MLTLKKLEELTDPLFVCARTGRKAKYIINGYCKGCYKKVLEEEMIDKLARVNSDPFYGLSEAEYGLRKLKIKKLLEEGKMETTVTTLYQRGKKPITYEEPNQ